MKMKKIQEKILVCIVLLCVTCMFAVIPVSAGNGPNPHPLDSQAWIMIKDESGKRYKEQDRLPNDYEAESEEEILC